MVSDAVLTIVGVLATVVLALAGYFVTYLNNLKLERRRARLERVNRQLKELYGPLLALVKEGEAVLRDFRAEFYPGRDIYWGTENEPTEKEAAEWRLWISEVFMPINLQIEKVIIQNTDLVAGGEIPRVFLDFCSHTSGYKILLKRWDAGDFTRHTPGVPFPAEEFNEYVTRVYRWLSDEQTRLLVLSEDERSLFGATRPSPKP